MSRAVDRDTSYALQQVVKSGTGANAQALGRPAAGKTGTATNAKGDVSSSWFVGYTPQLATAVMYVRGDGNDALNGYLPVYFGAEYPTKTWTSVMQTALRGLPVASFPPPALLPARQSDHAPQPTFTPAPAPTAPANPAPTAGSTPTTPPTPTRTATPTRTPTPTPTRTATPTPTPPQPPSQPPSNPPTSSPPSASPPGNSKAPTPSPTP